MGKINVLEPKVFNMLAAGEVVENPASVVKELVENSIDAGATEIDIAVEMGGIRKIQVSDNGVGILKEDMRTAFIPHATSKLSEINDLDSIATLGFRGEALASIASVSEITLISSSKGESSKLVLNGGNVVFEGEDSRSAGTIVTVENLFFNTPARLKFLKKPANEFRQILDTVRMLVLANPSISFTLSNEDGEIIRHESGSLKDAIQAVYGVQTADRLIEITDEHEDTIKISGFVSASDYTKPNRTYQTAIVNGRVVDDVTIRTAVEKAYGDYLMKRAYPMFVIEIVMPFDEVDVNVHPRKSEIRFFNKHKVFGALYHAVQNTVFSSVKNSAFGFNLDVAPNVPDFGFAEKSAKDTQVSRLGSDIDGSLGKEKSESMDSHKTSVVQARIDTSMLYGGKTAPKYGSFKESALSAVTLVGYRDSEISSDYYGNDKRDENEPIERVVSADNSASDGDPIISTESYTDNNDGIFDGKIIGQVFATYILVERDEKLYIIDQHAAHERILYDKISQKCLPQYSQPLLIPYKLSLTGAEEEYVERILPALSSMGFEIEHTGYVYLVKAVPSPVADLNFTKFFGELFANMLSENEISLKELLKENLCQTACKAAIKGGETLTREQIRYVLKNYLDENGNLPAKCPHGRPAVIALDKRDFEKMFKRIV